MATYAIGDIQGCFEAFQQLLSKIGFNASRDTLWLVGDLVNRGPRSLETIRFVKSLGDRAIVVNGNHDLHLLMFAKGLARKQRADTLDDIVNAPDCDELMEWLRTRPLMHVEDDYAMLHAGLLPQWTVEQALTLSQEAASAIQGTDYLEALEHLYGNQPAAWHDSLRGHDRLRVIVNALTRLRFCTVDGVMDLNFKGSIEDAPPGLIPWFAVPGRQSRSHTILFGHWSALGFKMDKNERIIALDSGCLWGGALTAVRLEDQKIFQVSCTD